MNAVIVEKKMVNNINYNDCANSRYWKIITAIMCVCTKTEIYVLTLLVNSVEK